MDKVFLEKYHQELKYFKDASKAFAEEHPNAATRLGLSAPEIEDPYVERLIEAVSFLTARINLKIDAEYPKFVQHLLKVSFPDLTQSIPSAAIVALESDSLKPFWVNQNTEIATKNKLKGNATCQFTVCSPNQIVPFNIQETKYNHNISNVAGLKNLGQKFKSTLSFSLQIPIGFDFKNFDYSSLKFFISAHDIKVSSELLYFLAEKCELIQASVSGNTTWKFNFKPIFNLCGFQDFNSFYNENSSNLLKHVLEYAVIPEKYLFFKIDNLSSVFCNLLDCNNIYDDIKINNKPLVINFNCFFNDSSESLNNYIDKRSLSLNSVVINNIFEKKSRIIVDKFSNEQHVVVDKLRPTDYEVIKITKVEGYSKLNHKVKNFEPIYKLNNHQSASDKIMHGFFSEFHQHSSFNSRKSSYKGSDCFIQLTNQIRSVTEEGMDQLSITAWCSNRALPSEISWTSDQDLEMSNDSLKVSKIRRLSSFTKPIPAPMENTSLWRILNLVASNFVALDFTESDSLTKQIKSNLDIFFEITSSTSFKSQVNAILRIQAKKIRKVKRIENMLTPITGLEFEINIDEMLMSHVHPYLWGRILLEYLKNFCPINHFVELNLKNQMNTSIAVYTTL